MRKLRCKIDGILCGTTYINKLGDEQNDEKLDYAAALVEQVKNEFISNFVDKSVDDIVSSVGDELLKTIKADMCKVSESHFLCK